MAGCFWAQTPNGNNTVLAAKKKTEHMKQDSLSEKLIRYGYYQLFGNYDYSIVDRIWAENQDQIREMPLDNTENPLARFLSLEMIVLKDPDAFLNYQAVLAEIYLPILSNKGTVNGNIWGLPNQVGKVGEHLLQMKDRVALVDALELLLDNNGVLLYEGSREATLGNQYKYRVKDIAAYYIAKVKGIPFSVYPTPKERDKAIKSLVDTLKSNK